MESLYATMITLLFSAWVWDLKGQVATPQRENGARELRPSPVSDESSSRPSAASRRQPQPQRYRDSSPDFEEARGISRSNGVPTWVIK